MTTGTGNSCNRECAALTVGPIGTATAASENGNQLAVFNKNQNGQTGILVSNTTDGTGSSVFCEIKSDVALVDIIAFATSNTSPGIAKTVRYNVQGAGVNAHFQVPSSQSFNFYSASVSTLLFQIGPTTVNSILNFVFNGGLIGGYVQTAINRNVLVTDYIVAITNTGAVRTMTLPSSGATAGQMWRFKDESGGAAGNNIVIAAGTGTIDGAASVSITTNYGFKDVYFNGTNYFTV